MPHPNSLMTPTGRHQLVFAIEAGASSREAAAMFDIAISTISRWMGRWTLRQTRRSARIARACVTGHHAPDAHHEGRLTRSSTRWPWFASEPDGARG